MDVHDRLSEAVIRMDEGKREERRKKMIALVIAAYDAGRMHDIIARGELVTKIAEGVFDE